MAKILLVEDDNNLREIYEARLQAEGHEIVSAHDGEEALVVAKSEKPDLIIADVMMPKISGFEMLDILRNTDGLKEVKVVMLTALGQEEDQQRASKLGADKYLVKSQVTLEDIVNVVNKLVGESAGPAKPSPQAPPPASPVPSDAPAPSVAIPISTPSTPVNQQTDQAKVDDSTTPQDDIKPANKKVIQPLPESNKPDINTLLAQEEAKEVNQSGNQPQA